MLSLDNDAISKYPVPFDSWCAAVLLEGKNHDDQPATFRCIVRHSHVQSQPLQLPVTRHNKFMRQVVVQ